MKLVTEIVGYLKTYAIKTALVFVLFLLIAIVTNLDAEEEAKAALFAMVAATGLSVNLIHKGKAFGQVLQYICSFLVALSTLFAAILWLQSIEPRPPREASLLALVMAFLFMVSLMFAGVLSDSDE